MDRCNINYFVYIINEEEGYLLLLLINKINNNNNKRMIILDYINGGLICMSCMSYLNGQVDVN